MKNYAEKIIALIDDKIKRSDIYFSLIMSEFCYKSLFWHFLRSSKIPLEKFEIVISLTSTA
jgi:hypothetical protein